MEGVYVFSIFDVVPYFFVLIYMLVLYGKEQDKVIQAKYCFFIIFAMAAIRYGVAYDYFSYKGIILDDVNDEELSRLEPLSRLLVELGRYTHYQFFFIIGSLLTIYPIYRICIKYSIDPVLSLIIYYLYPSFYLEGLGIVRNAIAFSFVFYAFILMLENKRIKTCLLLLCAAMFHKSAFIAFLIFPVLYLCKSKKIYLGMYVTSFMVSALIATIIGIYADQIMLLSAAQRYAEKGTSGGGMMTLIVNGLCVLNFVFWNRLEGVGPFVKFYTCSYIMGTCLWNVFLPVDVVMAGRFCSFFTIPLLLIVPIYPYIFSRELEFFVRRIILAFFFLLFTSHFVINIKSYLEYPDKMSTVPYQTIFWHTDYSNLI